MPMGAAYKCRLNSRAGTTTGASSTAHVVCEYQQEVRRLGDMLDRVMGLLLEDGEVPGDWRDPVP